MLGSQVEAHRFVNVTSHFVFSHAIERVAKEASLESMSFERDIVRTKVTTDECALTRGRKKNIR